MGKLGFCAYNLLNLIDVFDVYKVYATANVCYFYKNWIHVVKVGKYDLGKG